MWLTLKSFAPQLFPLDEGHSQKQEQMFSRLTFQNRKLQLSVVTSDSAATLNWAKVTETGLHR